MVITYLLEYKPTGVVCFLCNNIPADGKRDLRGGAGLTKVTMHKTIASSAKNLYVLSLCFNNKGNLQPFIQHVVTEHPFY